MSDNKQAYSKEEVINIYTSSHRLFKAEDVLIKKYASKLEGSTFLDIGVGGGRTTHFIAPLVKKYNGVDYSASFVSYVSEKYGGSENVAIEFGDARNLKQFSTGFFDFVLFSFNGIDCVGYEDRKPIISECFRLLKKGGRFWFSFHNLKSLPKLYSFQWPRNPFNWIKEFNRSRKVNELNGDMSRYVNNDHCMLRDGEAFFEAEVVYVQPSVQKQMLEEAGFSDIQYYNAQTGKPLNFEEANAKYIDWIYVDCLKP